MLRELFAPDLEKLLAPLRGDSGSGRSIRYEPVFQEIRKARERDDPTLPMGDWERPLKKADWHRVIKLCTELLAHRSKDLQLAAWLCEAWIHLYQIEGLIAGVDLIEGLIDGYWDTVHPQITDGDLDARVAPFSWINESLPLTLKLDVRLLLVPDRIPPRVYLADWDRTIVAESLRERSAGETKPQQLTRAELQACAQGDNLTYLIDMRSDLDIALQKWDGLSRKLDYKAGSEGPSLSKVGTVLRQLLRATDSLIDGRMPRPVNVVAREKSLTAEGESNEEANMNSNDRAAADTSGSRTGSVPSGPIASREDAYRMLEAAADYLKMIEPHSPTPYLVKRAVAWGQLSLVDLMQEIVREEGDLKGYFKMLGVPGN